MTTAVIISSPKPNHQNIKVYTQYTGGPDGEARELALMSELTDGESSLVYVHSGLRIVIEEVAKQDETKVLTDA
jgi:hypothetical protein